MLKKIWLTIATLISTGFLPLANATDHPYDQQTFDQPVDNRWYISPFGTFIKTDNSRNADDGWGAGMGIGKMINKHLNLEARGFYNELDGDGIGNDRKYWELAGGTLDMQYYFSRQKLAPYAVVALGGMNTQIGGRNTAGFIAEAGLGLTYEVSDNFLIRSDARYRYNDNQGHIQPGTTDFHDMTINVGFVIPFGAKPTHVAQTPLPIAPVAATPDCSTLDDDGDGVNNCVDRCPGTPEGSTVDNVGCPVRLILKGQHFNYDSAELTLNAMKLLDGVAESLTNYPQKNDIEVQGHASSEGSNEYNMELSKRRAESVVDYLRAKGISNRLSATGFGEEQPIADNSTEAGRSENRRVELIWIEN